MPVTDAFGRKSLQWMPVNIDEATLEKVASMTGGKYFRATDTDSLDNIYDEIDKLEKTKVEAQHFVDYRELAVQSYRGRLAHRSAAAADRLLLLAARLAASADLAPRVGRVIGLPPAADRVAVWPQSHSSWRAAAGKAAGRSAAIPAMLT